LEIYTRDGVYWNDGVEFTAEDVAYTIMLNKNTTGLIWHSFMDEWVETAYTEGKHTVVVNFTAPSPKFHSFSSNWGGISNCYIMPKHVWENVIDPVTFKNFPPVGTGAYTYLDHDPQGFWYLWERRSDWERSGIGRAVGKPKPKYLMYIYYENDEAEVAAMIRHELDWTQIAYELRDTLLAGNEYARSWYNGPPYAWTNGVCAFGTWPNNLVYPYNITNVRWALALSINITDVEITTFNTMGRMAYMSALSVSYLAPFFEPDIIPWYEALELSDGYKPWDNTVADQIGAAAEAIFGEPLPTNATEIYGAGWWKYDLTEAAALLEAEGFTKNAQGKWLLPDGTPWEMEIMTSAEMVGRRIGTGVAEGWLNFGIDASTDSPAGAIVGTRLATGDFDVYAGVGICSAMLDVTQFWRGNHIKNWRPIGDVSTTGNNFRWNSTILSDIIDEMEALPFNDPGMKDLAVAGQKEMVTEMLGVSMFHGSKLICTDHYAWTGMPVAENNYAEAHWWHPAWVTDFILPFLEPTYNAPSDEYQPPTPDPLTAVQTALDDLQTQLTTTNQNLTTLSYIAYIETILLIVAVVVIFLRTRPS
jgi:peptide/nickel transport system substrate-binding protein